ncbi:MAG: LysR family transcriptional regulator [Hyphomicrobiaceae bacterium]|nr:MAG: LysR family transcriptional regulator [Hyphomicrobiaceae bacterium]
MKARQLEIFRAVMQCGSLTGAARLLNVSQPALSQALKHTEDSLGFKLFQRLSGRIVPTAEALQLYPEAERLFRDLEGLRRFAGDIKAGRAGPLRIAASAPASLSVVPPALKSFRAEHPQVRTLSYVVPYEAMVEMLRRGEADLGVAMNDSPQASLETETLGHSRIMVLMQAGHALAGRKRVSFPDLARETLISYRASSMPGQLIARAAAQAGHEMRPEVEIDVSIIAASFVQHGLGIALVDGLLPWENFPGLVTRPFEPRIVLPVCLSQSRLRPRSRHQALLGDKIRHAVRRRLHRAPARPAP